MKANVFTKTGEITVTGWRILDLQEDPFDAGQGELVFGGARWYYISEDGTVDITGDELRCENYEYDHSFAIVRPVILFDGELPVGSYVEYKGIPYCVFESGKAIAMGGIAEISAEDFFDNQDEEDLTYETVFCEPDGEEVSLKSVVDNYFA